MTAMSLIFFALFAIAVLASYLAVRKSWVSTGMALLVGGGAAIICMVLVALGQGNGFVQALVVGFLTGAIFVVAAVAIASFFRSSESRSHSNLSE